MKTALGRGLESLIPDRGEEVIRIDVDRILPGEYQPRKNFRDESLRELSASIKEKGVLQPIIVSKVGDGSFKLIAGERRWRAAALAGLKKIPALIKEVSSQDAIEIALIENIQREELNPVETAGAFQRLLKDFNLTQEDLSRRVGKDRATISNYIRILNLPDDIRALINDGSVSLGHAKAILSLETRQEQLEAARRIVSKGLSVREAEALCKKGVRSRGTHASHKLAEVADLEHKLTRALGTRVTIHHRAKRGSIQIEYFSLEELDRLLEILLRG